MDEHVKMSIQKVLDSAQEEVGILSKWLSVEKILLQFGLAYKSKEKPQSFLVHPSNRHGQGINAYSSHTKGCLIVKNGADPDMLLKSTAFELSNIKEERDSQLLFNLILVSASEGYLAPVQGTERFLTVSSGHTVQFLKCLAVGGCKTPETSLQDHQGRLCTTSILSKDKYLNTRLVMDSCVLHCGTDLPNPAFIGHGGPECFQQQLPGTGRVGGCHLIAERAEGIARAGGTVDWEQLAQQCSIGGIVTKYAPIIAQYVKLYSGGSDAPLLRFCATMGKQYGNDPMLGQEFWQAITAVKFSSKSFFVFVRIALLACNYASPPNKQFDGCGKFIAKSDIDKIKKQPAELEKLERIL